MKILNKLASKVFKFDAQNRKPLSQAAKPQKILGKSVDTFEQETVSHLSSSSSSAPTSPPNSLRQPASIPTLNPKNIIFTDDFISSQFIELRNEVAKGLVSNAVSPEVIGRLTDLLYARPGNVQLLTLRAISCHLSNQLRQCVDDYNEIIGLEPTNKFALLHRLSAASSEKFRHYKKSRDYAAYLVEGQKYALLMPQDRLSLFVLTIWLEDVPGSDNIVSQLQDLYKKNPEDIYLGAVLMSAYLSRRNFNISSAEKNELRCYTEALLTYDSENTLAHEVLYQYFAKLKPYDVEDIHPDFIRQFSNFPLVKQDEKIQAYVQQLELV